MVLKRGQLTIFIIVGVVVAVGVFALLYYQSSADERYFDQPSVAEGVGEIKDYMKNCVEFVVRDSVGLVRVQGGYYDAPSNNKYVDFGNDTFLPYYYHDGESYVPSVDFLESEIVSAVDDSVSACVDSARFSSFDLSYGSLQSDAQVREGNVEVVVDMPVRISSGGYSMVVEMKEYPVVVSTKLKEMHNVARYFVEDISDDNSYCVNCLGDVANINGVDVDVFDVDEYSTAVVLSEAGEGEENRSYYLFLNKFEEGAFDDEIELVRGFGSE